MTAYDAQRERDRQLLAALARRIPAAPARIDHIIEEVLDECSTNPRLLSEIANELRPALHMLRIQRYEASKVAQRSVAARIDTVLKVLGDG